MSAWWDEVVARLQDGEWFADIALPLAVALIGIAVGVILVRHQMMQDRKSRRADRRVELAAPVIATLSSLVSNLEAAPVADHSPARGSLPDTREVEFWEAQIWPDEKRAQEMLATAIPLLSPDARQSLARICAAISEAWRAMDAVGETDPIRRAAGLRQALSPLAGALHEAADRLERWDGERAAPDLAPTRRDSITAPTEVWVSEFRRVVAELKR